MGQSEKAANLRISLKSGLSTAATVLRVVVGEPEWFLHEAPLEGARKAQNFYSVRALGGNKWNKREGPQNRTDSVGRSQGWGKAELEGVTGLKLI